MLRFWLVFILCTALLTPTSSHALTHPPASITVAHCADLRPFAFLDEQGEPSGYLIDYWKYFGEQNNVHIKFKIGTWQQSLDWVKNGEADIHGGLFFSKERDRFLDYGFAIAPLTAFLYIHKDVDLGDNQCCPVGTLAGGYSATYMTANRPEFKTASFTSYEDLFEEVATGKLKAFLSEQPVATYFLNKYELFDVFTSGEKFYTKSLQVAVKKGNTRLLDFLSKGWKKMDKSKLGYLHRKWFMVKEAHSNLLRNGIITGFIVILMGFTIRALGSHITRRHEDEVG